jgi:hypothetical protein
VVLGFGCSSADDDDVVVVVVAVVVVVVVAGFGFGIDDSDARQRGVDDNIVRGAGGTVDGVVPLPCLMSGDDTDERRPLGLSSDGLLIWLRLLGVKVELDSVLNRCVRSNVLMSGAPV